MTYLIRKRSKHDAEKLHDFSDHIMWQNKELERIRDFN